MMNQNNNIKKNIIWFDPNSNFNNILKATSKEDCDF